MQRITPFLWFDNNVEEAVQFYTSLFKNSKMTNIMRYGEAGPGPKGSILTATFYLDGQEFVALNGGPVYTFTPAISFFVNREAGEIDVLWRKLTQGGTILMELGEYPFSKKFGWVQDKFGISWQVSLAPHNQPIAPFLMFVGPQHGKAEEAINRYLPLFNNARIVDIERYKKGEEGPEGTVKRGTFALEGQTFMAIDSKGDHRFTFTPAISFYVKCETQPEIDTLWAKLTEGGQEQQCGWLTDRFGVSWQIVPPVLGEMLGDKDQKKSGKVMQAMLQMKKIDIATLKRAYQ